MSNQVLFSTIGTLGGVVISALVAYQVSRRQARNEIKKVELQIAASFNSKLHERRMVEYPKLSAILSQLASQIRAGDLQTASVRETWVLVRTWDGANSIFLSPLSMEHMVELRKQLVSFSEVDAEQISNKKARSILLPRITDLQLALKAELGVMVAEGFLSPKRITRMREGAAAAD